MADRGRPSSSTIKRPQDGSDNGNGQKKQKSEVVEILENGGEEQTELLSSLTAMFPDTPLEYLEEQVPDLAGKPAATERFVTSLLKCGSRPPEDWRVEQKVPLATTEEISADLNRRMVQYVMNNNEATTKPIVIAETEPVAGPSHTRVENDEEKMELKQYFSDTDPEFLHEKPIVIEETEPVAGPYHTRVENDEEKVERHFTILKQYFPHTDPEFLHERARDLCGDEMLLQEFIDDGFESEGKNFPTRKEYEKKRDPSTKPIVLVDTEPAAGPSHTRVENDGGQVERHFTILKQYFPDTDPEFLHERARDLCGDEMLLQEFIEDGFESEGKNFPTRKEYERKREHALLVDKYSMAMNVGDILEMCPDPEEHFSKLDRKASDLYMKLSLAHLKREFRYISSTAVTQVWKEKKHLYYPAFKELKTMLEMDKHRRKTRRSVAEVPLPPETDLNFLKELQFCRIENQVKKHRQDLANERQVRVDAARVAEELEECVCCYSDDVLPEEMVPCSNGHTFCVTCVQRASEVAIGDGKTGLSCLGQCEDTFELAILQHVLNANMFSKWIKKIQLAEVEKAEIDGLERCPFCEFATIMETTPEEDKVFRCRDPECGKESCRLCNELSHIPQRCDEVEQDDAVRKRTYIENKMTEALIRHCHSCKKPFFKTEGCNLMTCQCGASMCYLCRKPVNDYRRHFFGGDGEGINNLTDFSLGNAPRGQRQCILWSDTVQLNENQVTKGGFDAKSEADMENPDVALKHDPTEGLQMPAADPSAVGQQRVQQG